MKRAVMLSAVAAVLFSVGVGAQGRNFSGTWVIDAEKTAAAGGGAAMGGRGGDGGRVMVAGSGGDRSAAAATAVGGGARSGGGGGGVAVAAGGAGARAVSTGMSVTMDANAFTVVNGATTTTYKLDGSVTNIESRMGTARVKASWQGDKIAIETTSDSPNGAVVTHAFWYLEGEYLVRENKSTSADGQEIVRKTYYKRS
jgi:hypothetical protein